MQMNDLVEQIKSLSKLCKFRSTNGLCGAVNCIFVCDPFVCPKCGDMKK